MILNIRVYTGFEPQILKVTITTERPQSIRLRVSDAERKFTVFTDRNKTVTGEQSLYVRMPLVGKVSLVEVFNEAHGNRPQNDETTFTVRVEKMPLERKMDVIDFSNPDLKSFVPFFCRFAYNAGWMEPGHYTSSDGRFNIQFQQELRSKASGQKVNTPARIGENSGLIEISKECFQKMTVPMRVAIGLHEFSHFYLNENKSDEIEADLNGLLVYLGLGFPRIEAYQAFLQTFNGAPTELNQKRARMINRFITDFENNKIMVE